MSITAADQLVNRAVERHSKCRGFKFLVAPESVACFPKRISADGLRTVSKLPDTPDRSCQELLFETLTKMMCPAVLVFVLIVNSETSQGSFGKLGSQLSDVDNQDGKKSEGPISKLLKCMLLKKGDCPQVPAVKFSSNTSTESDLILSRFMKEMGSLFQTLPVHTQCHELLKVLETTSCNASTVQNLTSLTTNIGNCSWHGKDKQQSNACNRTVAIQVFQQQMGQVFASLSWPFKCNIVNLVAQTYKVSTLQGGKSQARISVQEAQDAIEKIFHFIHIQRSCSKAMENVVLPQISLVRLSVKLNNGTTKKTWVRNFKTKGPQIYDLFLTYQEKGEKNRPLIGTSIRRPSPEDIPASKVYVTEVSEGMQQFSVVFGLKIKKKGYFRAMKSSHKIVSSLKNVKGDRLNAVLQAKVVQVDLEKKQIVISTPLDGNNAWTYPEVQKAINLFPKNMTAYYKQVSHKERCFIMFQISSSLGRNPFEMEKLFNALNHVIRRRACYFSSRNGSKHILDPGEIIEEKGLITTSLPHTTRLQASEYTDVSFKSTAYPGEGEDQNKQPVEDGDSESDVSSLEYALFILLGLLCIATLAFTINYALFALRRSPNGMNRRPPNGMLPSEVVQQKGKRERVHCVHVTHNHQVMAMQEQQLPFAFTKSSSTSNDSSMLRTNHPTQSDVMQTLDSDTVGSGNDSGYSPSRETSVLSHASAFTKDLHSDTGSDISGNSKGLEPKTEEHGSETKTLTDVDTSPNPDPSVDLESRTISVASSLDSNTHSPSQGPEEYQTECSTGDSQDSNPSCNQSYETVSPEAPCEISNAMFDHSGIKEVQV